MTPGSAVRHVSIAIHVTDWAMGPSVAYIVECLWIPQLSYPACYMGVQGGLCLAQSKHPEDSFLAARLIYLLNPYY